MLTDERKHPVEVNSGTHLEMDEVLELLELARKTDPHSWCILTLAFNHGLRVKIRGSCWFESTKCRNGPPG